MPLTPTTIDAINDPDTLMPSFPMVDVETEEAIVIQVTQEALDKLQASGDALVARSTVREEIESLASAKFDKMGGVTTIIVVGADDVVDVA